MWRKIMWIYPSPLAAKTQMRSQMITNQINDHMTIIFVTFYFVQISPSPLMYLMYMYLVCPVPVTATDTDTP